MSRSKSLDIRQTRKKTRLFSLIFPYFRQRKRKEKLLRLNLKQKKKKKKRNQLFNPLIFDYLEEFYLLILRSTF